MGRFQYESTVSVEFDDRLPMHLQQVMWMKLRRGEPFAFTWRSERGTGYGSTLVWVSRSSSLVFTYSGGTVPRVNRRWLEALMQTANSPTGLYVVHEPDDVSEQLTDASREAPFYLVP